MYRADADRHGPEPMLRQRQHERVRALRAAGRPRPASPRVVRAILCVHRRGETVARAAPRGHRSGALHGDVAITAPPRARERAGALTGCRGGWERELLSGLAHSVGVGLSDGRRGQTPTNHRSMYCRIVLFRTAAVVAQRGDAFAVSRCRLATRSSRRLPGVAILGRAAVAVVPQPLS